WCLLSTFEKLQFRRSALKFAEVCYACRETAREIINRKPSIAFRNLLPINDPFRACKEISLALLFPLDSFILVPNSLEDLGFGQLTRKETADVDLPIIRFSLGAVIQILPQFLSRRFPLIQARSHQPESEVTVIRRRISFYLPSEAL